MNFINIKNNKVVPSFQYDPDIVLAIKSIDGRVWNKGAKQWEIPIENLDEVMKVLVPMGFRVSSLVLDVVKREREFLDNIEKIKQSDEPFSSSLPLFDFQHKGARFLKNMPFALLADVPGLGKSIQTLASTMDDQQILIFCPASLKYNWQEEIFKWIKDEPVVVIDGNKETRQKKWINGMRGRFIIANYELLLHDAEIIFQADWSRTTVVCDEATRISNPKAQTTKNIYQLKCKKRIALTGTPISNSPTDIFGIFYWLIPGYLGTHSQFTKKYCDMADSGWGYSKITGFKNLEILREKVGRFMLRRTKEEVFKDFPPKVVEDIVFQLSDEERKMYNFIKEQVVNEIKKLGDLDTRTLGIIPVKMLRLKQTTGHTELIDVPGIESTKLTTLKGLLEPIYASGEKAIIFTQFSSMLQILKRELSGKYDSWVIWGDVDSVDRMKAVKEFNDKEGGAVIIMTEAGAYGLNMQSASYVFHYDAPWSIAKLQQREDRAHRIGQNKPVTIYNLIAKNTIDEYVMKVLHKKQVVSVDILKDADRLEEMGLSKEDIDEILRL